MTFAKPVPGCTAPLTIQLATPAGLQAVLGLLGLQWQLLLLEELPQETALLYDWIALTDVLDPRYSPGAYVGVGAGKKRLKDEKGWVGPDASHGHGLAMEQYGCEPVGGPVILDVAADLRWLPRHISPYGVALAEAFLRSGLPAHRIAEPIAIRAAMYVSGGLAPVSNSHYAGAWNTDAGSAWAAWAAVAELRSITAT